MTSKVAIYARFSSDKQRDASIDDQFRLCREHAEKEGWTVVNCYSDRAVSGASLIRGGIQALITDAISGKFDVVLTESLDRISRDQEDTAGFYKRMTFAAVKIITLAEDEITHLHVGLKGTMNALFLKDLADKTRRGLRGRVEAGKAAGGRCYGYDVVQLTDAAGNAIHGERQINEAEAAIVRRIFREFTDGKSPRAIARDLNAEGVPSPRGSLWMDTAIRGHATRGTGFINNELYIGNLVWNRQRYIKDPDTGKRVSRINSPSEWIRRNVPGLRIIDAPTWEAAKRRQAALAIEFAPSIKGVRTAFENRLSRAHRPRFLLSGLLTCGVCGGNYTTLLADRYGCANHYRRRSCTNGRTIRRGIIEARVIDGLKNKLVAADAAAEAVRHFQIETNRLNREKRSAAAADQGTVKMAERKIKEIVTVIENGGYHPALTERLNELEREKQAAGARLNDAPPCLPDTLPNVAEIYRAKVARLVEALKDPEAARGAAEDIRSLVGRVVLTPAPKRGQFEVILHGDLASILELVSQKRKRLTPRPGVRLSVVAGVGFEPTTFRL
jgi:site-specific DNA recombinase